MNNCNMSNRDRNRILLASKASLDSQTHGQAYTRAMRQIRGVVQRIVHGRFIPGCHRVRKSRVAVKAGVVFSESGKTS